MDAETKAELAALRREITALEKLVDAKFDAQKLATEKAADGMAARFESVNEFRATLSDQAGQFVTRKELDDVVRRVSGVENRLSSYDGRILGISAGVGLIMTVITIVATQLAGG